MAIRVEVLLRRSATAPETVLKAGAIELDLIRREVTVYGAGPPASSGVPLA